MIHGLFGRELCDGRQDSEGVGSEQHYVIRMAPDAGDDGVGDEFNRIGGARVFGVADVGVVGNAGFFVDDDVFEHCAEADGVVDLRFLFFGKVDAFGVASALEVEDAVLAPAVLVVADEAAGGVGGEGGLAGA